MKNIFKILLGTLMLFVFAMSINAQQSYKYTIPGSSSVPLQITDTLRNTQTDTVLITFSGERPIQYTINTWFTQTSGTSYLKLFPYMSNSRQVASFKLSTLLLSRTTNAYDSIDAAHPNQIYPLQTSPVQVLTSNTKYIKFLVTGVGTHLTRWYIAIYPQKDAAEPR